ncbi:MULTISPECIES: O-antigen ligase family protein [unclassified Bradyrhizobium]
MIPAIDKTLIGNLSLLVGCLLFAPRVKRVSMAGGLIGILAALYLISPIVTSALNNDPAFVGGRVLPGVGYYDGVSALILQTISLLPFLLGGRFLNEVKDVVTLLRVLVVAALIYSLPMLFEIRMSPLISQSVYGVFPSSYAVEARYGGFRPVVFMINGLATAFFLATATIAAAALWRAKVQAGVMRSMQATIYLGAILLLSKSAGALLYGIVIGPMARWLRPKLQMRLAVLLACVAILYPVLRLNGYVPTKAMVELASVFNKERADSLNVRFEQEDRLLNHAASRFWFGWGRYGRSRVYDEYGEDKTLTDGQWIIVLGQFGIVGFFAQFGLLTLPVFRTWKVLGRMNPRERALTSTLALIVAVTVVEQLPNASINPWSWLLAGALYGLSERIRWPVPLSSAAGSQLGRRPGQIGVNESPSKAALFSREAFP